MKVKKRRIALAAAALAAVILWISWGNTALMVNNITVSDDKIPPGFSGFRIAQLSDLHNASFGEDNQRLVDMLSAAEPDIILLTGDLIDANRTDIGVAVSFAKKAVEIAPTYFASGNHEAAVRGYQSLKSGLEQAGVVLLENRAVTLERGGDSITLAGIDDPNLLGGHLEGAAAAIHGALAETLTAQDGYTILMAHRPEHFERYAESGAALVFSGHAHGGQFRLPFVGGLAAPGQGLFPKYDSGLYRSGETAMIVSRGLGNSIFPFRVNNRPEIVVAELAAG